MMEADRLRRRFTEFFVERGHRALPPASLVANDPTILFTIAGMVPFKPYFLGEQAPPAPRVTTIQPCLRTSDIEIVGTTANHCTFFEMLGNFSFGDYFKAEAIPWAWEFVTEVLELDPDRLFVTVHVSDDEAAEIWRSATSLGDGRLQRLDEDNFWQMGDTGPCGPDSEIFFDRGAEFGPEGGPAAPGADESDRYIEVWNLVFTQYDRATDGALSPLPKRNIDTGAGLDRLLVLLQGAPHVQAIDSVFPVLETAAMLTKRSYGSDPRTDTSLRIVADHARAFTFCVADGVFPSNEGRGYVLRRLVRRAVLRTQQLGRRELVTPDLVASVVATMGTAYPNLERDAARIEKVILHEEEAFLRTLAQGTALLDEELGKGAGAISGDVAFRLHDTFGFPFELTKEVANERGVRVDEAGYEKSMDEQRRRAREAARQLAATPEEVTGERRRIRLENGPTIFAGYCDTETDSRIVAVLASAVGDGFVNLDGEGAPAGASLVEVFLDITPFYAEGGGQVGDTGELTTATGKVRVIDTTATPEGLTSHLGHLVDGHVEAGEVARAAIDVERRDAIRRNHTGTHLLHSALRTVLGDHVRQQGSLVAPDRLRFDFSHFSPLSAEEIAEIEDRVNSKVIADEPVATVEASKQEAEAEGAISFFGEKYGERVRVVHAGHDSVELCGGTHVTALGMIGPIRIVSEGSIGANTRRIEAVTGAASLTRMREVDRSLAAAAVLLRTAPEEVPSALGRLLSRQRGLEDELQKLQSGQLSDDAGKLAELASGAGGAIVARKDGLDANQLRELALKVRDRPGVRAVGLAGSPGDGRVVLVVAVGKGSDLDARPVASAAARAVGGGGGGSAELATAGGRDVSGIEAALETLVEMLGASRD